MRRDSLDHTVFDVNVAVRDPIVVHDLPVLDQQPVLRALKTTPDGQYRLAYNFQRSKKWKHKCTLYTMQLAFMLTREVNGVRKKEQRWGTDVTNDLWARKR